MKVSELITKLVKAKQNHGDLNVGVEVSGYHTGASEYLDADGIGVFTKKIDYINIHNNDHAYGRF